VKRKALVTGSAGFIGRHMCAALNKAGFTVVGIDIRDGQDARSYFRSKTHYDVVVHAAAVVGGRQVIDRTPLEQAVNLELDAAMFSWALRTRPGRIVYLSSSAIYPTWLQRAAEKQPIFEVSGTGPLSIPQQSGDFVPPPLYGWEPRELTERDADYAFGPQPDALYGWVKLTGEKLAALARAAGLNVSIVRPFSGYGEDQDDCYPFPAFAARARRRDDPFVIWGSGGQVRDWVHVEDICRAAVIMIINGIDGPVNIGWGIPVSMLELAQRMCSAVGYAPEFEIQVEQPTGVMYRVADVTQLSKFFTPIVSLDEGIGRALKMGD
jgi:nucleoside-diphosphate-sugar epimerase